MAEEIKFTKYETARILGARALQISMGAPFLIKLSAEKLEKVKYNPIEIAKLELQEGVIPMSVKRPYPVSEDYKRLKEKAKAS